MRAGRPSFGTVGRVIAEIAPLAVRTTTVS